MQRKEKPAIGEEWEGEKGAGGDRRERREGKGKETPVQ
jgi:hypothetical protein